MPSYRVFGVRLDSDLELPELPEQCEGDRSDGIAWRVEARATEPPDADWAKIGSDSVFGTVEVRAYSASEAIRLSFDDTGTFDIHRSARKITWYAGADPNLAAVRADLLGRVMAFAAHADGRLALHASAVSIQGRAIAFLGPKHAGKSTLALALVRRGARLLTDDTLVVRIAEGGVTRALPGVQQVRLWDDSARALGVNARGANGAKPTVRDLRSDDLEINEVPLGACYVLRGAGAEAGVARRAPLSSVQSALAYVQFSKLGALGGGAEGSAVLDRAVRAAGAGPAYVVDVRRELACLDEVAARFEAWHAAPLPGTVPNAVAAAR